jgi:hypothetical protein
MTFFRVIDASLSRSSKEQLFLFSAHDSTIAALFSTFGICDEVLSTVDRILRSDSGATNRGQSASRSGWLDGSD